MLYYGVGVMAALAVIALSPFILRALGLPAVWRRLGVIMAAAMAAMTSVISVPLPVQILEGASSTGLICLWVLLLPRVFFKEIWGTEEEGKDE